MPASLFALTAIDPQWALSQMNLLVSQYESRIKQLEAENTVLKYEMVKAGIKIPLDAFSGAIATPLPTDIGSNATGNTAQIVPPTNIIPTETVPQYTKDISGFIIRITKDWSAIRSAYSLPANARIAAYEFVQTGAMDHIFTDIVIGTGTTGIYDMKILYQFDKSEYKRKLIGIFIYDISTGRYITKNGSNPFGGVARVFVRDPAYSGSISIAPTASLGGVASSGSTSIVPKNLTVSSEAPVIGSTSVTLADITKAYNEKRYLTTIALSNSYLTIAKPTVEILSIRYRTYFIIGKYSESLAEIAKIEAISMLDRQTACNAQVIATYSKNQSLVDRYTAICKK